MIRPKRPASARGAGLMFAIFLAAGVAVMVIAVLDFTRTYERGGATDGYGAALALYDDYRLRAWGYLAGVCAAVVLAAMRARSMSRRQRGRLFRYLSPALAVVAIAAMLATRDHFVNGGDAPFPSAQAALLALMLIIVLITRAVTERRQRTAASSLERFADDEVDETPSRTAGWLLFAVAVIFLWWMHFALALTYIDT